MRAAVRRAQPQRVVEREHARREVREDAFEVRLGVRELGFLALRFGARLGELQRHAVERAREHAELVAARVGRALAEVALRDRARAFDEHVERRGKPFGQQERGGERGEQREQQRERERDAVEALQAPAREQQLLVFR